MLPPDTSVPDELARPDFVATPLTLDLVALDHAAYVASPEVITRHSDGRWPVAGFTLDEDRRLVAAHEADHRARRSFAYLLLDVARSEALGCLYLNPMHDYLLRCRADPATLDRFPAGTAMVTFWVRQDLERSALPRAVAEAAHEWLSDEWPVAGHVFRVLPQEVASREALEHLRLRRVRPRTPGEHRPYLWYR